MFIDCVPSRSMYLLLVIKKSKLPAQHQIAERQTGDQIKIAIRVKWGLESLYLFI